MANREVTVRFLGDSSKFTQATDRVDSASSRLKSKLGDLVKGAAFTAGGAAAVAFAKTSVEAFKESEEASTRFQQAFAKNPALVNANIADFERLNAALAKKTKYDDDATASGQAVLAGFGLTSQQLQRLTPLLQDYASRTGKDLPTAAADLGKAIQGKGKALAAIGIQFSDTGSAAGNFDQLVGKLSSSVGGFAEKEGKTAAGRAAILSNQFGELQEKVGAKLVPALSKLADIGLKVVAFFENLSPGTQKALMVGAALVGVIFTIVKAVQAWTAVQAALNIVLTANPIGLIVIAVAALVAGIIYAWKHCEGFRDVVQGVFRAIGDAIYAAVQWIKVQFENFKLGLQVIGDAVGKVVDFVKGRFNAIVSDVRALVAGVRTVASGIFDPIANGAKAAFNMVARFWNSTIGSLRFNVPDWVPGVGGRGFSFPKLPVLHNGGIVPGPRGAEVPILAQAGEGVLSLDQMSRGIGGGVNVTIKVEGSVIAERDLVDIVRAEFERVVARGGTIITGP